jgi:hypothetical protein
MYDHDRGHTFLAIIYSVPYGLIMWGSVPVLLPIWCVLTIEVQHAVVFRSLFTYVLTSFRHSDEVICGYHLDPSGPPYLSVYICSLGGW